jgi:hypothetical protein
LTTNGNAIVKLGLFKRVTRLDADASQSGMAADTVSMVQLADSIVFYIA